MDARLRQILELALRPDTGEGESAAALAAARRLVAKQGMDLLGVPAPERVIYRDKVVYRKPSHEHECSFTLTIPARYHHTMMERVFLDGENLNLQVQLISCKTLKRQILSGTVLKFKVLGTKVAVTKYSDLLDSYVAQMNEDPVPQTEPETTTPTKQGGWFKRLFGL